MMYIAGFIALVALGWYMQYKEDIHGEVVVQGTDTLDIPLQARPKHFAVKFADPYNHSHPNCAHRTDELSFKLVDSKVGSRGFFSFRPCTKWTLRISWSVTNTRIVKWTANF